MTIWKTMGSTSTKTDNARLGSKLELRRYYLRKYHATEPPRVFDCCQGDGMIWRHLQREFTIGPYWGVDVKPKKGRLRIDSARVLDQPGWEFDVIDVDTYGEPWKHWAGILEHFPGRPLTVFLTIGHVSMGGGGGLSRYAAEAMGIRFARSTVKLKSGLYGGLSDRSVTFCLARAFERRLVITDCMEAAPGPHARYFGLRLERA
jgi:hypothetical protein